MDEVSWVPGVTVLVGGIGVGAVLAWLTRGSGREEEDRAAHLADLQQAKASALEALKDLEDVAAARGIEAAELERSVFERRAALAMKELEDFRKESPTPAAAAVAPATGGLSPQARGALQGGLVVAFLVLVGFALMQGSTERKEGMSITGGPPMGGTMSGRVEVPSDGRPGAAVSDVPPSLQPKASPAVDQARALVSASPQDPKAWAQLGYALVDAEGWIDVWNTSNELLKVAPGNPDGLVLQAIVRLAMGMDAQSNQLIDEALGAEPDHAIAWSYRGTLAWRAGDRDGALVAWKRANQLDPQGGYEELVAMAENEQPPAPRPAAGSVPPGHPPAAGGSAPPPMGGAMRGAAAPGQARIAGTLRAADGLQVPPGAVVFVVARQAGVQRGPPAATARYPASFPLKFELGDGNVMMGGPFPDSVDLSLRLDLDGNAMTREEGGAQVDAGTVASGSLDLDLVLGGS